MKKMKQRIVSCSLVICIIATLVPAFGITAGAVLEENEALYTVNQNDDGITDNVIVAEYNGVSYAMGAVSADGKGAAVAATKRSESGNDIVIDETAAELFKVESERIIYSYGSYSVYRMITDGGYLIDSYGSGSEEEHKLAVMDKETADASDPKPNYNWRFDWTPGWYNSYSNYRIYLVVDGDDMYFQLCPSYQAVDETHIRTYIFHKGCQHTNMEYVPAVAPTCKQDGSDAYWYCPDCDAAGMGAYFSDADGLNSNFNPPITMSYGAIDVNQDGVCDDCGKNMPVFKKVTNDSHIVAGGKYILVSEVEGKYYAAATGSEEYGNELPAVEITPAADGTFTFEGTTDAMTLELQFANGCTEWGNGIRYGFITKFNGSRSEFAPDWGGYFFFSEYDMRGAKYGFYVGLDSDGKAKIHSAYDEAQRIRSYTKGTNQLFSLVDYSADESYTEKSIFLYRLTDTGTVGTNTYDMTAVKSQTDYTVYDENGTDAEGGTNITGVTDALTQTAINTIVQAFVEGESISDDANIQINTSVNVSVTSYTADNNITLSLMPTAVVSGDGSEKSYDISDSDFDGITPMTVVLYTGGISPAQIIHEKQNGTNEYFYPEYSDKVMVDGEKPFYELYDNDGNRYVLFTVTEFSDIRLLAEPITEDLAVTDVTIDKTLAVNIGETKTPVWTVFPEGATNKNVTFTINDTSVAIVNQTTGEVTGVKAGTATLTVKTEDGNFTDTCTVTVSCTHANKIDVLEKASTCLEQGWDAYKKCSDCEQLFTADGTIEISEIPLRPLSHIGGTATCTEKAVCTVCHQPYGDYAAHDFSSAAKKAEALKTAGTCKDKAVYYYSCAVCGDVEHRDSHTFLGDKDESNHVGGTTTVGASEPDHKTQTSGYTGDTKCLGCKAIIARGTVINPSAHTPADVWSQDGTHHWKECTVVGCGTVIAGSKAAHSSTGANVATCQNKAICDVCNVAYGEKAAHDPASGWTNDASGHWHTCQTAGCTEKCDFKAHTPDHTGHATEEYAIKCSVCEYVIEAQLEHTHNFNQKVATGTYKVTDATCTAKATYYKSCTCGEKGTETFASGEFAPHKWTPATCTAPKVCSVCHTTEGDALGHTESTEWKSDDNNHWHICTVVGCGVVIDDSKAAHTASDWITDTAATATTDGTKHKECTICHRVLETGTIPATGGEHSHSYTLKYDKDNHWQECGCGSIQDKAAHTFGGWTVVKVPTAILKGEQERTCSVCSYKETAEIPATGGSSGGRGGSGGRKGVSNSNKNVPGKEEKPGWNQQADGNWKYVSDDGKSYEKGWITLGGITYHLDEETGVMDTGWYQDHDSNWFYLGAKGAMAKGWVQVGTNWYYMNPKKGYMQTGWVQVDSKWYYLHKTGAMATGWIEDKGKWYYLKPNGTMATGWVQVDSKWYYLHETGVMATGWIEYKGKWYYLKPNGAMATGWVQVGDKWYCMNINGQMYQNAVTPDGYQVDASGAWVK